LIFNYFFYYFLYSGRDASHPEILFIYLFIYTVMIPAAPHQETGVEAGIEPGTAAWQPGIS
jgi:hypothetical protein